MAGCDPRDCVTRVAFIKYMESNRISDRVNLVERCVRPLKRPRFLIAVGLSNVRSDPWRIGPGPFMSCRRHACGLAGGRDTAPAWAAALRSGRSRTNRHPSRRPPWASDERTGQGSTETSPDRSGGAGGDGGPIEDRRVTWVLRWETLGPRWFRRDAVMEAASVAQGPAGGAFQACGPSTVRASRSSFSQAPMTLSRSRRLPGVRGEAGALEEAEVNVGGGRMGRGFACHGS